MISTHINKLVVLIIAASFLKQWEGELMPEQLNLFQLNLRILLRQFN